MTLSHKLRETVSKIGVIGELFQVQQLLQETVASLRSQHEILRKRGVNLAPGVIENLSSITGRMGKIRTNAERDYLELQHLRAMMEASAIINSSLDIDNVLNQLMDNIINLTGAERGYILLSHADTDELEFRIARSIEAGGDSGFEISKSVVNQVMATGEAVLTDNAAADPRLQEMKSIVELSLRSILCVPLKRKDDIVGVIYLANRMMVGVFQEFEVKLLSLFANQAAVAIENAHQFGQIKANLQEAQAELQQLRIDVDHSRTDKQVGEITETEYFRQLMIRAADLRRRKDS